MPEDHGGGGTDHTAGAGRLRHPCSRIGCAAKAGVIRLTEVPVTAPRSAGGQWVGAIDLLVELANGQYLVVDHKSRPIPAALAAESVAEFSGQLAAYREILEAQGLSVAETWIHLPLAGVMCYMTRLGPLQSHLVEVINVNLFLREPLAASAVYFEHVDRHWVAEPPHHFYWPFALIAHSIGVAEICKGSRAAVPLLTIPGED